MSENEGAALPESFVIAKQEKELLSVELAEKSKMETSQGFTQTMDTDVDMTQPPNVDETEVSSATDSNEGCPREVANAEKEGWTSIQEDEEMVSVGTGGSSYLELDDMEEDEAVFVDNHKLSRPFDIELLQQSIDNGSTILDDIQGKDVVLVVGKTGTGKSTLIQALAGKPLFATEYTTESFGQTITKKVYEVNEPLPGFEIGHRKASQTRHINCHVQQVARKDGTKKDLVYLDSPGFEDTEGSEVDIATAVMLTQVAKVAQSLRFVIMINYVSLLEDRGGAMRGILKIVRSFVDDFETSKLSFMFLFTHTDEISKLDGGTLQNAKEHLHHEILLTLKETKDKDVIQVLTFMRQSLGKSVAFVEIFHPLQSDLAAIRSNINKLRPVSGSFLAKHCGLTVSAKFKLAGELSKLLQALRSVLGEDTSDPCQAKAIYLTFRTLERYIQVACVQETARHVEDLFETFWDLRKRRLGSEVERGTTRGHSFGAVNIKKIRQYAAELSFVAELFPTKRSFDSIFRAVQVPLSKFAEQIVESSSEGLGSVVQDLNTLSVWSEEFPEFLPMYQKATGEITSKINNAISPVEAFVTVNLECVSEEEVATFVRCLGFLRSIVTSKEFLSKHFELERALCVFGAVIDRVGHEIDTWCENDDAMVKSAALAHKGVDTLVARARVVECLYTHLNSVHITREIREKCSQARQALVDAASTFLSTACSQIKDISTKAPAAVQKQLFFLSGVHQSFQTVPDSRWNDLLSSFRSVVDQLNAYLRKMSGELEEMTKALTNEGLTHGSRDSKRLTLFQEYIFFDLFLPAKDRFVSNCYTAFSRAFRERAERICYEIDISLAQIESSTHCPVDELRALKLLLTEENEFVHFASVLGISDLADAPACTKKRVAAYARRLAERSKEDLTHWTDEVETNGQDICHLTERLDNILQEFELLREVGVDCTLLESVGSAILQSCFRFTEEVRSILGKQYAYPGKLNYLRRLEEISKARFSAERLPLPQFEQAKAEVRKGIKVLGEGIASMIEETANWDEIDALMEKMEKAKALDHYTSGEATSRIGPLLKLRAKKEAHVGEALDELIEEHNYKGIADLLLPSSRSKDQLIKTNFDRNIARISEALKRIDDEVRRRLNVPRLTEDDFVAIAEGMLRLDQANQALGKHVDLSNSIKAAKNKLNKRFSKNLEHIHQAASKYDFVTLGERKIHAVSFEAYLQCFLSDISKRNFGKAMKEYREAVESVPTALTSFFESNFKGDKIVLLLSSLKSASQLGISDLNDLKDVYESTTSRLTDQIVSTLTCLRDHVEQTKCFDDVIEVIDALERQFQNGLEEHVLLPSVVACIRDNRSKWAEERSAMMQRLMNRKVDSKIVQSWKQQLDSLDPSTMRNKIIGFILFTNARRSYDRLCESITEKAVETVSCGSTNIRRRDFALAQECIVALEIMEAQLSKHISAATRGVKQLKKEVQDLFDEVCKQAKHVLEFQSRRLEFQEIFEKYRALAIAVPSVTKAASSKRSFALTNQLIYEALNSDLGELKDWESSFDFPLLKEKIENVRIFGEYLADYGTLFLEEVRCCEHVKDHDEWLERLYHMCVEHFGNGRNFSRMNLFGLLGLPPSATKSEIKKAYRVLAKKTHPDKQNGAVEGEDEAAAFREIKNACDELMLTAPDERQSSNSFERLLKGIHSDLRQKVREFLSEQRYGDVETILYRLGDLHILDNLLVPPMESSRTNVAVKEMVKSHVERVRVEIETNWSSRNYLAVNQNIEDLKLMEEKFKSYPEVFSESWSTGIYQRINDEIDGLGQKARSFLFDRSAATNGMQEFRRCFINMGLVLCELAPFKEYAKKVMGEVLESCLEESWGYSYLFDFGLSLQKTDDSNTPEENLAAQVILSEFSHFKEVLTMVWNEETSQKPAEDTVKDIRGQLRQNGRQAPLKIDDDLLLDCLRCFEAEYKILLGEYLPADADNNALVRKTIALADSLKPIRCNDGWGGESKKAIPQILAGVFALFTVLKSGASYNRVGGNDGDENIGEKLLMKPHNIQVLTLLCMFGCSSNNTNELESQLLQIRTGEGKSMILGAGAVVLGLLGFRVRCVCYSDYLSTRDYNLFREVFDKFNLTPQLVKYSKITTLSEDATASKGDIRQLTDKLLHGQLPTQTSRVSPGAYPTGASSPGSGNISSLPPAHSTRARLREAAGNESPESIKAPDPKRQRSGAVLSPVRNMQKLSLKGIGKDSNSSKEEILLVDEVDVFFGPEFYGRTYNQVVQIHEPEVKTILQQVWDANKTGGRRLRLNDIKSTEAYQSLVTKLDGFAPLIDSEISSMLGQVRLVDEEPYYVDKDLCRIGYKVMDSISFEATYGYRTVFAYMKEVEAGSLPFSVLSGVMAMQVSCGQFSYANISPSRILGVSGTLDAMSEYEKDVLAKYGVEKFLFVPSVYGGSNFTFDKGGEGIRIESSKSDYYHSITDQIQEATKQKRAVIVFFEDNERMSDFIKSPFYPKLGRQKTLLSEEMTAADKEFVISKAATAGQVTISSAVFARGTDFFCKDDRVQKNGGVHVIQAFLSKERSEEIQTQGRTARQGKKGSFQMILLETDLKDTFGVPVGTAGTISKIDMYGWLESVRDRQRQKHCKFVEDNLLEATKTDKETHRYFDALLAGSSHIASRLFSDLYKAFKKKQMPSSLDLDLAFVIDSTGSMSPFSQSTLTTIGSILNGPHSIGEKLRSQFPDIEFRIRVASMAYKDLDDDASLRFVESAHNEGGHFTESIPSCLQQISSAMTKPSGGGDIAEDHLGAILRCSDWKAKDDWTSQIKFLLLLTDAPAHGMSSSNHPNADNYPSRHPQGLTPASVLGNLLKNEIDLFFCSFNPPATQQTENELVEQYLNHPDNTDRRELTTIKMVDVPVGSSSLVPLGASSGGETPATHGNHIIFVLDESGSMRGDWAGVVVAYNRFIHCRRQNQCDSDLVSVVQFDGNTRTTVNQAPIHSAPSSLGYSGGGTCFYPAANAAVALAQSTPASYTPVVVFMSDGEANDFQQAAQAFGSLRRSIRSKTGHDLELHVIAFGRAYTGQLQTIANASPRGKLHMSADTAELSNIFVNIAGGQDVAQVLQAEVGKRISEAVADRLAIEYLGS